MHVMDEGAEEFFAQYYNNCFDWDEEKQGDILWDALYVPDVYRVRSLPPAHCCVPLVR